ncbi:MAG: ribonuclease III [Flavobacteriia bacterium]|nr:ribonuclease III [Flavobacteriia bacterium]OIP45756.1 MAG: ribonuclease III [Flavobacteriaceae bacterium CG2_30_31_66]PIV97180.1 MAG: ribonuclease III [Flavobacteriaceae bacterium CG17_big_fil_post_rev_8_21_14_2_50_31_13]PIX12647.1 MAG: ribonuclease III [Flavobacteriaceae bacterium CG_4_8_14_3_um_filter_31_8]PIY15854.1 MAG: ribonuclease III [Flavobacteriaceae bacterium CG_4_10_14_3_um_filter_31_253]PIZ12249.1 MAG: ribonuclease III [Flavobacteriaceae bacterium CG_4_10_14_0_8_um_filter_31_99]
MNFIRKIVHSFSEDDKLLYYELKKLLNFSPKNISKYKKAFTHRSTQMLDIEGNPLNYERLEFLGDSILGSVIAAYLYKKVPTASEGYLTQMRSKIVSREHLNELGKDLNLIRFVKSNIDQSNVGDNIHGNIFEALVGAIYLDKGYNYCESFIFRNVIAPHVDIEKLEGKITSYKGLIIEWCQKQKKKYKFETYEDTGNEIVKHFSVKVSIDGVQVAKGRATSKKKAEEMAAKRVYFAFQNQISVN